MTEAALVTPKSLAAVIAVVDMELVAVLLAEFGSTNAAAVIATDAVVVKSWNDGSVHVTSQFTGPAGVDPGPAATETATVVGSVGEASTEQSAGMFRSNVTLVPIGPNADGLVTEALPLTTNGTPAATLPGETVVALIERSTAVGHGLPM